MFDEEAKERICDSSDDVSVLSVGVCSSLRALYHETRGWGKGNRSWVANKGKFVNIFRWSLGKR